MRFLVNPIVEANHMSRKDTDASVLAHIFESRARWREAKAHEYPDDDRNARSARALSELARFVETPERADDPRIKYLVEAAGDGGLGGDETARAVARFGFTRAIDTDEERSDFLSELCALVAMDSFEELSDSRDHHAGDDIGEVADSFGLRVTDVRAALAGRIQDSHAYFARHYGSAAAINLIRRQAAERFFDVPATMRQADNELSDDDLLDFDYGRLADFSVTDAVRRLDELGDVYRAQLVAARWIEGWRERYLEARYIEDSDDHRAGVDWALREVAAHLRQGDLVPGGVLYDEEMAGRWLRSHGS